MKTIFPQNKKAFAVIVLLFLVLFVGFNKTAQQFILKSLTIGSLLRDEELKEKNSVLETEVLSCAIIQKENEELKTKFYRQTLAVEEKYILAGILSAPPRSPYDVLILDGGAENGIQNGMAVIAYNDILIGYVAETFPKTSKIKMVSFPGEETSAILQSAAGESHIFVSAIGKGGGNMEIKLPNSIEVKSGDYVITPGLNSLILGITGKIEVNLAESSQTILFRAPLNIQELKYVMIK